ncbi:MAG: PaaI family thioesterase [Rhodospirillales bacterium]|nr:MAG: PaaI family thioesterase [Rhodospirillales bacterium]
MEALKRAGNIAAINDLIPYARAVGLEAITDDRGLVTVLRFREGNIGNNLIRAIHGGVIGALLEQAAILHLIEQTEITVVPKIVNLSVDYLRPCLAADTFARGRVIKQGRRIANVRAEAWQADPERPVAAAHAHFLIG